MSNNLFNVSEKKSTQARTLLQEDDDFILYHNNGEQILTNIIQGEIDLYPNAICNSVRMKLRLRDFKK